MDIVHDNTEIIGFFFSVFKIGRGTPKIRQKRIWATVGFFLVPPFDGCFEMADR